jgi:hypothetical protein
MDDLTLARQLRTLAGGRRDAFGGLVHAAADRLLEQEGQIRALAHQADSDPDYDPAVPLFDSSIPARLRGLAAETAQNPDMRGLLYDAAHGLEAALTFHARHTSSGVDYDPAAAPLFRPDLPERLRAWAVLDDRDEPLRALLYEATFALEHTLAAVHALESRLRSPGLFSGGTGMLTDEEVDEEAEGTLAQRLRRRATFYTSDDGDPALLLAAADELDAHATRVYAAGEGPQLAGPILGPPMTVTPRRVYVQVPRDSGHNVGDYVMHGPAAAVWRIAEKAPSVDDPRPLGLEAVDPHAVPLTSSVRWLAETEREPARERTMFLCSAMFLARPEEGGVATAVCGRPNGHRGMHVAVMGDGEVRAWGPEQTVRDSGHMMAREVFYFADEAVQSRERERAFRGRVGGSDEVLRPLGAGS